MSVVSTVLDVCGPSWLGILCLVAAANFAIAIKLTFFSRSLVALVAFLPIALLPLWVGVISTLFSLTQAIQLGLEGEMSLAQSASLLVAMAILPVTVGATLSVPAYAVAGFGRFWFATRSLVDSKPTPATSTEQQDALASEEAAYQQYAEAVAVSGHRRSR